MTPIIESPPLEGKKNPLGLILGPKPTWTEIGLCFLILFGAFLGSLKRYAPVPEAMITLGFDALCFGLLGYVFVKRLVHSRKIPYSPLTLPLIAFMGFVLLTIFNPMLTSMTRGLLGWRFLASGLLFHFLGFYAFDDIYRLRRFLKTFWVVAGLVASYGIIQWVRGYTNVELAWINDLAATMRIAGTGQYRLMSTMGSAVDLGFFMALAITSLIGIMITSRRLNIIYVILLGLMIFALVFTFVRAAWVAVFGAILYLWIVNSWQTQKLKPLFPVIIILLTATLLVLIFSASFVASQLDNPALQERVASLSNPLEDKSMIDRYERWSKTWSLVIQYPFGVGVGMTGATSLRYMDNITPTRVTTDNSYLKILIETGWLGLLLFGWLLASTLTKGSRIYRRLSVPYKKIALPLLSCFVSFVIILLFGEYIELNPSRAIIWMFTGFLFSLPRLERNGQIVHQSHDNFAY